MSSVKSIIVTTNIQHCFPNTFLRPAGSEPGDGPVDPVALEHPVLPLRASLLLSSLEEWRRCGNAPPAEIHGSAASKGEVPRAQILDNGGDLTMGSAYTWSSCARASQSVPGLGTSWVPSPTQERLTNDEPKNVPGP